MRTFIAFDIDENTRASLARAQCAMGCLPSVRWVRTAGIHLTLKFLGEIEEAVVPGVLGAMRAALAGVEPFEFAVRGLGWFPPGRRPRVLWAGVEGDDGALNLVAGRLNEALVDCGVRAEKRAFRAHLTLARVRGRVDVVNIEKAFERVSGRDFGSNAAEGLVLYMSELHPTGARYTRLGEIKLEGEV